MENDLGRRLARGDDVELPDVDLKLVVAGEVTGVRVTDCA